MAGVFITRGMTVTIPAGGLRISFGADAPEPTVTLHVHFDVCPTWCELAMRHVEAAKAAAEARKIAWQTAEDTPAANDAKAMTLEKEFEASMQAVMAAAIAVDALYAVLQEYIEVPDELLKKWRERRTARYSQVAEVIRRAFNLKRNGVRLLLENLKKIYRLRDLAVHPSGKVQEAVLHPELGVGVEWRFVYFRAETSEGAVNAATAIVRDLAFQGKPVSDQTANYLNGLRARLNDLFPQGHPLVKRHAADTQSSV